MGKGIHRRYQTRMRSKGARQLIKNRSRNPFASELILPISRSYWVIPALDTSKDYNGNHEPFYSADCGEMQGTIEQLECYEQCLSRCKLTPGYLKRN